MINTTRHINIVLNSQDWPPFLALFGVNPFVQLGMGRVWIVGQVLGQTGNTGCGGGEAGAQLGLWEERRQWTHRHSVFTLLVSQEKRKKKKKLSGFKILQPIKS